jgi:hypothetical protein
MTQKALLLLVIILLSLGSGCEKKDSEPPRVIQTDPLNESRDVDPSLRELSVTFNEEMMDGNWSWAYEDQSSFPRIIGQAFYTDDYTINRLPVKLDPDKEYVIWINSAQFKNFKDKSGNSAIPFRFTFRTRD